MGDNMDGKSWNEYSKHVLASLDSLTDSYKELASSYNDLNTEFQVFKIEMKLKSGVWGLLAGAIPSAIVIGVMFLKGVI